MTREEANNELIEMYNYINGNIEIRRKQYEALNMAIEALKQPEHTTAKWIPLRTRPMDEDEQREWSERLGYKLEDYEAVIYTSPLPDDGQNVLICLQNGDIVTDTFEQDDWDAILLSMALKE